MMVTPMQERLRAERAMFHAVVYWRPGCRDADELEAEFRRIAETGFDAVRCHNFAVEYAGDGSIDYSIADAWLEAADRAGIRVILHLNDQREPDDRALAKLGLSRDEFEALAPDDPRYRETLAVLLEPAVSRYCDADALLAWGGFGEPGPAELDLVSPEDGERFARWLRERYGTVEALDAAWNLYPEAGPVVTSFDEAWTVARLPEGRASINGASNARLNYGAQRDRYRFATDRSLRRAAVAIGIIREADPDHPILTGSHQLFLNQPSLGWDIPRWAKLADVHFSSIHMSWHFEPVEGEVDRPVYFQARQTRDYFKGGWTSAYETTGGPVQYSGGYGNHMDA
ncbi:MAG: beta-galactosidase, partial [Spirochaetota bacterium]